MKRPGHRRVAVLAAAFALEVCVPLLFPWLASGDGRALASPAPSFGARLPSYVKPGAGLAESADSADTRARATTRYGGEAPNAIDMKAVPIRLKVGVRYGLNAPRATRLNRPLMDAVKAAADERFNACYNRHLEAYPERRVTTLAFRVQLEAGTGRVVKLSRAPGAKDDVALAQCVGLALRKVVAPVDRPVAADFRIQFAHAYQRPTATEQARADEALARAEAMVNSDAKRVASRNKPLTRRVAYAR